MEILRERTTRADSRIWAPPGGGRKRAPAISVAGSAPQGGGFGPLDLGFLGGGRLQLGLEAGDDAALDVLAEETFDGTDLDPVARGHEGDRVAGIVAARGAADAVHVVSRVFRDVEVHDMADAADVQASRGHVRGDEDADRTLPEPAQRLVPLVLVLAAVQARHRDIVRPQVVGEVRRRHPRPREDEHLSLRPLSEQMVEEGVFLRPVHGMEDLTNTLRRGLPPTCTSSGSVISSWASQRHAIGHRGREEERLPRVRRVPHDLLHVVDEPHVQHAVGLVEHEDFDAGQVRVPALHMVEQPAGRGDKHIAPEGEFRLLGPQRRAAVDDDGLDRGDRAVERHRGGDLLGEFAGGRDDEASRSPGVVRGREPLHGREGEGRRSCRCPCGRCRGRPCRRGWRGSPGVESRSVRCTPPLPRPRRGRGRDRARRRGAPSHSRA